MACEVRVVDPGGDERRVLNACHALRTSIMIMRNNLFGSNLHFIASVDNAVLVFVVSLPSSAIGLERVVVDAAGVLFHFDVADPLDFHDLEVQGQKCWDLFEPG